MMMDVEALLERLKVAGESAGFHIESLLKTPVGDQWAFTKRQEGRPCVYLSSGVHGDEPAGPLAIAELLEESYFTDAFDWVVCPALNPQGIGKKTRETGHGIDMNRDYFQRLSEEVQAHSAWLENQSVPDMFLSLHEDWESSGIYLYEINFDAEDSIAGELLKAAQSYFEIEQETVIDDHEVTAPGWIFHAAKPDVPDGWPEAIFLSELGCPLSFTFETPSSADLRKRIDCHKAMVKAAITEKFANN